MNRRKFMHRAAATAAGFGILRNVQGCAPPTPPGPPPPVLFTGTFTELRDRYFLYSLDRNPVTSTYLGGDGYSPTLATANSRLRDYRAESIAAELAFYRSMKASIVAVAAVTAAPAVPATGAQPAGTPTPPALSPRDRADYELMIAQLDFLMHQMGDLKYHLRSLDTYVSEPFRGIDWQIQQMAELPGGLLGQESDWQQVVTRTLAIPAYLEVAKANLLAGKAAGIIPDRRMVQRDGINGSASNAEYFRTTLPKTAQQFIGTRPFAPPMVA
ncbi:MAG TPA: DUF885 family protein, partial [Gemmatimonadaceae bacterium]|nr:DUF885 family protein [Gemmatimonadaceae bacterium]